MTEDENSCVNWAKDFGFFYHAIESVWSLGKETSRDYILGAYRWMDLPVIVISDKPALSSRL